ncbi:flagellar motor switch protein FliN [Ammoniphilus resinae]|uniref:Flagellar motor switch protein FliN n=1 Tax=Ammoniphilus resinae TaxID=861532 RepID=A0ABS4GKL3_9BACL|nr:flagellar motor switch protein FliN [Ammoniphilus resinae]MBP1930793.1 flagellar motor switch protein FliN [Ammoniphilus resinae]
MNDNPNKIQAVQFSPFPDGNQPERKKNPLELLLDIPLELKVELGRTMMRVEDILALEPGSVFVINKLAGERVDVIINNHRMAMGEVVVLDENFGVRIMDIVNQKTRLNQLK